MKLVIFGDSFANHYYPDQDTWNVPEWVWYKKIAEYYDVVDNQGISGSGADSISRSCAAWMQENDPKEWHCVYITGFPTRLHYDWMDNSACDVFMPPFKLAEANRGGMFSKHTKRFQKTYNTRAQEINREFYERISNTQYLQGEHRRYTLEGDYFVKQFASGVLYTLWEDDLNISALPRGLQYYSIKEVHRLIRDLRPGHFREPNHAVMLNTTLHHLGHDVDLPKKFYGEYADESCYIR